MRTLFFDIMQAEDVLFICILSSKPETRTTSRKRREAAMQVSKILLSLWVWYHLFVSGNICTCVHRTTFYEIMSITTIKHATESITLNIVSLLSMLMCLSNDIAHHNPSQLAILPGNTFSIFRIFYNFMYAPAVIAVEYAWSKYTIHNNLLQAIVLTYIISH